MFKLILCLFLLKLCSAQLKLTEPKKNFMYGLYKYDKRIDVVINNNTEQILDFYEDSDIWEGYPTRVHVSTNNSVPLDHPVFITATQQKGISSWELPMVVQKGSSAILFNEMGRTLCPHDAGPDLKTENRPTIHLTTQNPQNTTVDIKLRRVTDFYVEINKEVTFNVTPSTPKYFYFSFDQNPWNVSRAQLKLPSFNYTIPKSVIVVIDSPDSICASVSIQNNSCPVFDEERELQYQGYHLTMIGKGGVTLTQSMFPRGFYLVFVVKENDDACTGNGGWADDARLKSFRLEVSPTVSYREYLVGALVLLAAVLLAAALAAVPAALRLEGPTQEVTIEEASPSTSQAVDSAPLLQPETDIAEEPWSGALTVARLTRTNHDARARRANRYFWSALTVAVVYSLPVVQLLVTYQRMVYATGSQDLCYYNFLCAHPLGALADFNHVYSNVAYVVLAVAFAAQVRARQRRAKRARQELGIPQHFGLLYSMALALCMEGFLSACYHLCPNKMNFQFDSSFMYVMAVLVLLALFQRRHADLVPRAHTTFLLLAGLMALGVLGILFPSAYFSALFTVLHLAACLLLTLEIYYAGTFSGEWAAAGRAWAALRSRGLAAARPAYAVRAALLATANVLNWSFAIYSLVSRNEDFARQLLAILLGNALLYTMVYGGMKLAAGERPRAAAVLYAVAALAVWPVAIHYFLQGNTRWSETPAQSRMRNGPCTVLSLFDSHDLWHVCSAAALYLSFNLLLTIDDDREHVPRAEIATF